MPTTITLEGWTVSSWTLVKGVGTSGEKSIFMLVTSYSNNGSILCVPEFLQH